MQHTQKDLLRQFLDANDASFLAFLEPSFPPFSLQRPDEEF
jgi:hypothetical protein